MSLSSTFIRTDVTAVTVYNDFVLAGIGSSVYVYLPNCTKSVQRLVCLHGQKIYGFRRHHINKCYLIVFGGKQFTIILGQDLSHDCPAVFARLFEPVVCNDWLHSILWTPGDKNTISVLTAHNVVQVYNTSTLSLVSKHSSKDNSILYSGLLLGLESAVLVMAGTVFSEVILHVCGEDKPLHRLKGHKGVIFSISCDPEKNIIITTSDDRSLRIWGPNHTPVAPCNSIEYWKSEIVCKHELYGHCARVMRSSITDEHIISVGEDSTLCLWLHNGVLDKKINRHQSAGIWSIDTNGPYLLTGGGDGGVIVQSYPAINNYSQSEIIDIGITDIGRPKHISYSAAHNLFILTETNRLIYYDAKKRAESVTSMSFDSNKPYHTLSVSPNRAICAVAGRKSCIQLAFEVEKVNQFTVEFLTLKLTDQIILSLHWAGNEHIVVCAEGGSITVFIVNGETANTYAKYTHFELPNCKERWLTCAAMDDNRQMFIFGDRCGGLHLYRTGSKHPLRSFSKLHGRYGPTSIIIKRDQVTTTGRDKTIKHFSLSGDELTHTRTKELGFYWVERFLDEDNKIVCGFNDKKFMVFNLSANENVFDIACGGGHRSWDVLYSHNEAMAQIELQFVYLKQSRINTKSIILSSPVSVRKGSHSKEINCLRTNQIDGKILFFSGGEDTTVRVSSLDNEMDFEDLVICKHLSSVRTLKMYTEGDENLVITAGGRAQICIKSFKFIKTNGKIDVNTRDLVDYMLKGTDKERKSYNWKSASKDLDPETRIMDVDYIKNENNFTLFTGCSDARVRVFIYETDKPFQLINESKDLGTCILKTTCVNFMQRDVLITCSTRGEVAFWDASHVDRDFFEPFFVTSTNKSGINSFVTKNLPDDKILIASGGDDNDIHMNVLTVPDCLDLTSMRVLCSLVLDKHHSSAVTGLCLVGDFMLSTSIDQRITLYRLKVTDTIECGFVYQTFSDVADIKGMDVITRNTSSVRVCVFGKGVEVFDIPTSLT